MGEWLIPADCKSAASGYAGSNPALSTKGKFMRSFKDNNLNNFIAGWYIDTDLCDLIVTRSENNLNEFSAGVKEYTDCYLQTFNKQMHTQYCEQLVQVIEEYKKLYPYCYKDMHVWGWTPPRIQRYDPNKAYRDIHCENNGLGIYQNRHLAYMTYLNDVKVGGGTEFVQQGVTTNAEKGLTLIWPAGWTHHHRGVVAPQEVKYIITGWMCFYPDSKREE